MIRTAFAALALAAAVSTTTAPLTIPDVAVVDQSGRKLHFYRDLIEKKVVVLAFFYTHCRGTCPIVGRALAELQSALGDRLGRDVFFVSVSIDPRNDTTADLAKWGRSHQVRKGWTLVTGEPRAIGELVREVTGNEPGPGLHAPALFILNDRTGEWLREGGNEQPRRYAEIIDAMIRRERSGQSSH